MGRKSLTLDGKNMHKKDIIAIIDACFKSGVAELKFGDLEVKFHKPEPTQDLSPTENVDLSKAYATSVPQVSGTIPQDEILDMVDKDISEEARITRMLIENPAGYEQLMIDNQLGSLRD